MFASSSENLLQTTGLSLKPLLTSPTHSTYVDARLLMYTVHFILLITQSCCSHIRLIAKVCHFCSVLLLFNCLGHYYWRRRDTRWPAATCCHCRQQVFHRHWAYHCHEGLQSPDGNAPHVLTDLSWISNIRFGRSVSWITLPSSRRFCSSLTVENCLQKSRHFLTISQEHLLAAASLLLLEWWIGWILPD